MTPEHISLTFSIGGLLFSLLITILFWAGVFAVGGAGWKLSEYLYRKSAAIRWTAKTLKRIAVFETVYPNEKEALDALKSRLSALDKFTWFALTVLGTAFIATTPGISTVKVPGLEVPAESFGAIFYVLFLGSMLYYLKVMYSVEKIVHGAKSKEDIGFQIASHSGILSPFSESASITGRILDLLGFSLLICMWWGAFEVGRRLTIISSLLEKSPLGTLLPWAAVIIGIWSLFATKQVMGTVMTSKPLFVAKLLVAVVSLPCAFLIAQAF